MSRLALFDFDGTITKRDTLIEFIRYYHGTPKLVLGLSILSPVLLAYKAGIIPNWRAKEKMLQYFFKGHSVQKFNQRCSDFAKNNIPLLLRPIAMKVLGNHIANRDEVIIVSASPENWVRPWCDQLNIKCIATCLETENGLVTGKISGKNCHGEEKVSRIKSAITLEDYTEVFAYGDTSGDKPMLALAGKAFYKPFR